MGKYFKWIVTLLITILTLSILGNTVLADEKVYDNIKDGEYEVGVEVIEVNSEEKSAADGFLLDRATLSIDGDDIKLTFDYTKNFEMDYGINWTNLENDDPTDVAENDKTFTYTFQINEIKESYKAAMNYYVPGMPGDMGDEEKGHSVDYRIVLNTKDLNGLPEDEPKPAPEERVTGDLIMESEADAVYQLNYETDSKATAGQLENPVKLLEKDDKQYIQIPINERGAQYFRSLKFNETEVTWNSITGGPYTIQFELLNGVEDVLDVSMVIQAGPRVMPHDDIKLSFDEDSLETIKEPEDQPKPEQPKPAPEERVVGDLIMESDADAVYQLNYETDSKATAGQLENPVKLLEQDGKQYIQIPINERGAQYFRSLKFNGKEVTWNSITDGPYTIQFELPNGMEDVLDVSMVIQAGPTVMPHDDIKLWFEEPKPEEVEIEQGEKNPVKANDTIIVKGSQGTQLKMPKNLPQDVTVTITSTKDHVKNLGDIELAGDVYNFDFGDHNGLGAFELVMGYDQEKYPSDKYDVSVYYYDEANGKWIPQDGTVKDGKITIKVDHFSTYGVFAKKIEEPKKPVVESKLIPDKAYEIDYVIKHAIEDRASAADGFFKKPATLLYKNGQKYVQLTVTNSDMINSLSTANGDVLIVEKNKDGSMVVQFKVDGNLSDVIDLNMFITVPGVYDNQEHDARIFLNEGSMKKDDATNYLLVAGSKGNKNGPIIEDVEPGETIPKEDPEKPEFGPGNDNGNGNDSDENTEKLEKEKGENPQTGDTTSILLYAMLLIGSLIPLAVKLRRRFI